MSFSKSMGLVLIALVVVGLTLAVNDRVFRIRWFFQPPGDAVLTAWHWYQPVEVIGDGPGTPLPVAPAQSRSLSEDALIEAIAYAKSFDSIAFLAAHNGVLQIEHYGEGFDWATVVDSQSMHKGFLGVVTAIALDKGFIPSLHTPAADYIPSWAGDERKAITVGHLLEMSSGLAQAEFTESPFSPGQRLFFWNRSRWPG